MTDSITRTNYALLLFYVREQYWRHAEEVCVSTIQATDDHMFRVWRALTLDQQGMTNDALREYKAVESRRFTAVPALMGMQLIYKRNRDQEGVAQTETKLEKFEVSDHMGGWVQAAALCWAAGDINAARDLLLKFTDAESAMAYRDEYTNYGTIRAWVDLLSGRGALLEKAGSMFSKVLELEEAEHAFFDMPDAGDALGGRGGNAGGGGGARGGGGGGAGGTAAGALKWTDLNAALGYVAYLERKTQLTKAQALLDRLVVLYPTCSVPPLVGKARLLMQAEDWEQAIETTRRILARDKDNVEALTLEALYALVKDTRYDAATVRLRRLVEAVKATEPRNVQLQHQFGVVFSRLAGDRLDLLNITTQFSELACALESRNGDALCGLGYQQLYKHDLKTAMATFRKAATLTDSLAPLLGTAACLMQQGDLEEASKQLSFCNELQPANQRNAQLSVLNAQLRWRRKGMEETTAVLRLLDTAAEAIRHDVAAHAGAGMAEYSALNAPVSLAIAREYLLHCRNEPPDPMFKTTDIVGEKCARHLEFVVQHLPACMEAQLMLAKVWFVTGEVRKAQNLLKTTLIVQEQPLAEAFLLSSQICQYVGDVKLANRALEQALTLDFTLQEQPLYNLLLGTVQGTTGKAAESLQSLQRAYDAVKSAATSTSSGKPMQPLSVPERVTLHLQLAQAHLRTRDVEAARTTLAEAAVQFRDSAQSGRVAIAQAMLAARTDVDKSIELLRQVPSTSAYYISAHTQLGKLFLTQKHNVAMYVQCFQEMAEAVPTAQSYVELGEAYSTIQEPEQAIAAYEKAKALSPSSTELSVRVGRALVAAHDYAKAIRYYQEALSADPHLSIVRADLATLLWRLGRVDDAHDVITQSPVYEQPAQGAGDEAVSTAIERVNLYLLLYKVLRDQHWMLPEHAAKVDSSDEAAATKGVDDGDGSAEAAAAGGDVAMAALVEARRLQKDLIEHRLRSETADVLAEQRVVMASICTELGARCIHNRPTPPPAAVLMSDRKLEAAAAMALQSAVAVRLTQGKDFLTEAITYDESSERAQLQSALLCRRTGDIDGCERHCTTLLRMAGGSQSAEEAATLLANVYTQQGRMEEATALFEKLLSTTPQHYEALVDFVVLLQRAGHVEDALPALERATAAIPPGQRADPGLSYARGLYEHLRSNNAEALRHFNLARLPADNPWCERALVRMIWIYLVPMTQDLWVRGNSNSIAAANGGNGGNPGSPKLGASGHASNPGSPAFGHGNGNNNELHDNIRYAEQLLLLLPVQSEQRQVLQAYCTMATQRPEELETAMHLFLECIVAAETGTSKVSDGEESGAPSTAAAPAVVAKPKRTVPDDDSDDEDLQLLAQMHSAAANMAQRGGSSTTATLAYALKCKVVHPTAFLGLAMSLFVSNQETAARNVLARVLEQAKIPLIAPQSATAANGSAASDKPLPGVGGNSTGAVGNGKSSAAVASASGAGGGAAAAAAASLMHGRGSADSPAAPAVAAPAALLTCSEDDTLERAMLLQAYMDVQSGQSDNARYLLLQVLAANKGCGAAWDALGMLYERQHKHKEASECYQKAWVLLQESDPAVGYKLGFNYLRGSEPVKAIDVCKRVLAHHATYPRIEEDVMDVAYSMLRP